MLVPAHHHLPVRTTDLDHVEGRARGHAESLALANGEIVDAAVLADDCAIGCNQFASGVGKSLSLLGEISVDKALVVAPGHEANLLRVRLFGNSEAVLMCQFSDLGLRHFAEREQRASELFLDKAEKKICLILALVRRALQKPSPAGLVEAHARVVTGNYPLSANLPGHNEKLVKLQVIVTEAAGDWRAPGK